MVLMMDPLWGSKHQHDEYDTVDNPENTTPNNNRRSLKSNITLLLLKNKKDQKN